jgi:hypothetical protein
VQERECDSVGLLDAIWHILNLLAPAVGTGVLAASLAKLFWRSELKTVAWLRLCAIAVCAAAAVLIGGLVLLGHDGRMATYAAMVVVIAFSLWWIGFRPFRS